MRKLLGAALAALAVAACTDSRQTTGPVANRAGRISADEAAAEVATRVYDVTITNLTSGQPFSPGVLATHDAAVTVWRLGSPASEGIRLIAEDGDNSVAVATLTGQPGIFDVKPVGAPTGCVNCPGPFGTSQTIRITARADARRLSLAVMLICTNDGFTGLDDVKLPKGFRPKTFYTAGYDAGTEVDDELSTHIVDPCFAIGPTSRAPDGNLRTPEHGVITMHLGIRGIGDLIPAVHGWKDPVARITIQRVKQGKDDAEEGEEEE